MGQLSQLAILNSLDGAPKTEIRLGQINFINCLPINYALEKYLEEDIDFEVKAFNGVPAELNAMLGSGLIDIAPISSFEYLRNKEKYELIKSISISSKREADSVLLFSHKPIESLKKIYITNKSATSVNLLKVLLIKQYSLDLDDIEFVVFDAKHNDFEAKLLIGDEALIEDGSNYEHVLDLGAAWGELSMGLPMVFGLWTLNKESKMLERKAWLEALFLILKDKGLGEYLPDVIVEAYRLTGIPRTRLLQYFERLDYNYNAKHEESLELFEQYLKECKLL